MVGRNIKIKQDVIILKIPYFDKGQWAEILNKEFQKLWSLMNSYNKTKAATSCTYLKWYVAKHTIIFKNSNLCIIDVSFVLVNEGRNVL